MADHTAVPDFVAAVECVRKDKIRDPPYSFASERLDEAAQIAPCAAAFARAEVLPNDPRPAVGRYADRRLSLSRSIGYLLRRRLSGASEETLAGLRSVVMDALAFAYSVAIDLEGEAQDAGDDPQLYAVTERSPEEFWNWWVVHIITDAEPLNDRRFRGELWDFCHARVLGGLHDLGLLPPMFRRIKLKATTGTYAAAGLLLRMGQSTDLIDQDTDSWRHMTNMWPWEEYAQ